MALVMIRVKSPMLVAIGMYLPFATVCAIFVGGMIRWVADEVARRGNYNEAQLTRIENTGVLAASGLIAGEALTGLLTATFIFLDVPLPVVFKNPSYAVGIVVMAIIAFVLIRVPLANAGRPEDPAPPAVMM